MFLYLGSETTVRSDDVIGIFDLDNTTVSRHTRDFLRRAEQNKIVRYVNFELPKSFVLTEKNGENRIYVSQISTTTLLKRSKLIDRLQ